MDQLEILRQGLPTSFRQLDGTELLLTLSRQFKGKVSTDDVFALEEASKLEDDQIREAAVTKIVESIGQRLIPQNTVASETDSGTKEIKRIIF